MKRQYIYPDLQKNEQQPAIVVTGGAGYIGSHVCKELKKQGYLPIAFDNLSDGHASAVKWGPLYEGSIQNKEQLDLLFSEAKPSAVIHLAGSSNLRESIENPYKYYFNNVVGSLILFETMIRHGIFSLVFSGTAAIYDTPTDFSLLGEDQGKNPTSPYGKTKWIVEQMLSDFQRGYGLNSVILRYFNAAGADLEGETGEKHVPETHLIPKAIFVAQKKEPFLSIYHTDHPTKDKTAIRDYTHVSDLARGHVLALKWLETHRGSEAFNLGTGIGYSVFQIIQAIEEISGEKIPLRLGSKNPNLEPSCLVANIEKAQNLLGWTPHYSSLNQIISSAWKWHNLASVHSLCSSSTSFSP